MKKNNQFLNPIQSLRNMLSGPSSHAILQDYYGPNSDLIEQRRRWLLELLATYQKTFPQNQHVFLLRVPGRINLMGVHIDHRGGWCNFLPIARETLICCSPRQDDRIVAKNCSSQYPDCEFSLSGEIPQERRGSWIRFIESVDLERGHWGNYLKAGALKLQDSFPSQPMRGLDMLVWGDIPCQSGLSSSSALVVGAVLALREANALPISRDKLVGLCGEGEWYVGTRGGSGDHSAILLGRLKKITHTGFLPLKYEYVPYPEGYDVVIAQSGIEAGKATHARETFNLRIASYEIAFEIYKHIHRNRKQCPSFLRDISPASLEMEYAEFYTSLKSIPVSMSADPLLEQYPELQKTFERIFSTYGSSSTPFPLRETLLFGIAECDRAKRFPGLLRENKIKKAGRFMVISHDGDRVSVWNHGKSYPYRGPYQDRYLNALSGAARYSPYESRLAPAYQPGGYRCSVPELDFLVDQCIMTQGVAGAGLTGAGLGGAILVLVERDKTDSVIQVIRELMLRQFGQTAKVERCCPVAGASFLRCPSQGKGKRDS